MGVRQGSASTHPLAHTMGRHVARQVSRANVGKVPAASLARLQYVAASAETRSIMDSITVVSVAVPPNSTACTFAAVVSRRAAMLAAGVVTAKMGASVDIRPQSH